MKIEINLSEKNYDFLMKDLYRIYGKYDQETIDKFFNAWMNLVKK